MDYIDGTLHIHYNRSCHGCRITIQQVAGLQLYTNHMSCDGCHFQRLSVTQFEVEAKGRFSLHIPVIKLPLSLDILPYNADLGITIPPAFIEYSDNNTTLRLYSSGSIRDNLLL